MGGLISYAPNFPDPVSAGRRVRGQNTSLGETGDLPVEQPTKFDLIVNLTTAKALGLTIHLIISGYAPTR